MRNHGSERGNTLEGKESAHERSLIRCRSEDCEEGGETSNISLKE